MKILTTILLFVVGINYSFAQNDNIAGIYCSSNIRSGLGCISLNNDNIAYDIIFSDGSIDIVNTYTYVIIGDTIKISDYMNFYRCNNTLYGFNAKNEVVLKGGLKKASNNVIKKIQKRYKARLKGYNLCIRNGLIDKL
jgi:hypothetical protein